MTLTSDERNLVCVVGKKPSRKEMINALENLKTQDPEMPESIREVVDSAIEKCKKMSAKEYLDARLYPDYTEE